MMHACDTLIIGSGLTGLLLAHRFHHAGHKILLTEGREQVGGVYRRQADAGVPFSAPEIEFFPATNECLDMLEWLKAVSPIPLHWEVKDHQPLVFESGEWRHFSGFGETEFTSVRELSYLSHPHQVVLSPGLDQVTRALAEQLPVSAKTLCEATRFTIKDGKVTEVLFSNEDKVTADRIVFTGSPDQLNKLIEGEALSAKTRARLAKNQLWTAVILELTHKEPLVEQDPIRFFSSNAKDFEPVVGRAQGLTSRWMTLVSDHQSGDHEFVSQAIRYIKRQLKRAWPNLFENEPPEEKIYILPKAYGHQHLALKIDNLFLASHLLAQNPSSLGRLEVAHNLNFSLNLNKLPELGASC